MKNLNDFDAKRNDLLKAYDLVISSKLLLPVAETGVEQVKERKQNLIDEKFYIAVCGQIKSGKSTLINALIFGDDVLPMDDTIMTAKNTLIQYGDNPVLEVEFYDKEEWKVVKSTFESNEEKLEEFNKAINRSAEAGVYKDECIQFPRRKDTHKGFDSLVNYVCPFDKGGKFNPFVKSVKLSVPNLWLKDVIIADTPGVNDPLKSREDITKEFVTKAGAVIYVTYAGRPMDQSDFDFLDNYLLHVPSNKRIIAVNKIDTVPQGLDEVERYIESLRSNPNDPRLNSVFGDEGSIVYTSSLGALISKMKGSGKKLSKEFSHYYKVLERSGYLESSKNGFDTLKTLIEERLINLKGKDLLDSHEVFLSSLFEKKIRVIKTEITGKEQTLADLDKSNEQLEEELEKIKGKISELIQLQKKSKINLNNKLGDISQEFSATITETKEDIKKTIRTNIERYTDIKIIAKNGAWEVKEAVEKHANYLYEKVKKMCSEVEDLMRKYLDDIRKEFVDSNFISIIEASLDLSAYDEISSLKAAFSGKRIKDSFESRVDESVSLWQRLWNTNTGQERAKAAVIREALEKLEENLDENFHKKIIEEIKETSSQFMSNIEKSIKNLLNSRSKELEGLLKQKRDRDEDRKLVNEELHNLQELQNSVKKLQNEMEQILKE